MSDLINEYPNWGETGSYPPDGFFYDGGDQVNEKHLDALWNAQDKHQSNLNTSIRDRVRDLHDNVNFGTGLVASTGGGTREVDVTSTNTAYVDGERVTNVSAQTVTLTANGTGSLRTDVVYLDKSGTVSTSEGTTTVPNNELKIAEADVNTSDTLVDVRNYARDHLNVVGSEYAPSARNGDLWFDVDGGDLNVRRSGTFETVPTTDRLNSWSVDQTFQSVVDLGDNSADPASDGEIARNGTDVKVHTGGSVLNLTNVSTSSYSDEDAQDAVGNILSSNFDYNDVGDSINMSPHVNDSSPHHVRYSDSEAVSAVENEDPLNISGVIDLADNGADPNSNGEIAQNSNDVKVYTGGSVLNLSNVGTSGYSDEDAQDAVGNILSGDFNYDDAADSIDMSPHVGTTDAHHSKYTDSEAVSAVEGVDPLSLSGDIDLNGNHIDNAGGTSSATGSITVANGALIGWENTSNDGTTYINGTDEMNIGGTGTFNGLIVSGGYVEADSFQDSTGSTMLTEVVASGTASAGDEISTGVPTSTQASFIVSLGSGDSQGGSAMDYEITEDGADHTVTFVDNNDNGGGNAKYDIIRVS